MKAKKLLYLDHRIDDIYRPEEHFRPFFTIPFDVYNCPSGELPSSLEEYTHIVVSGCSYSVNDDLAWMRAEQELLRKAAAAGINILAVCFGHQLLAAALFGKDCVKRTPTPEVGWVTTRVLEDDCLLGSKGDTLSGFAFHFDEVTELPEDQTKIILSSERCAIHAFKVIGKNIWGVQTHFEVNPEQGKEVIDRTVRKNSSAWSRLLNYEKPLDSAYAETMLQRFFAL